MIRYRSLWFLFATTLFFYTACTDHGIEEAAGVEVTFSEGTNMAAALSPNGQRLALALQGRLWLLPVSGGTAVPVTGAMSDVHEPAWSPDGQRIAFQSYRNGNFQIWLIGADGAGLEQVTDGIHDDREPVWSPDGESILFASDRGGSYDLWRLELADGSIRPLTAGDTDNYHPAVSPDGGRIAFVSRRNEPGIWLLEEGEERLLVSVPFHPAAPSWSPDGEQIYFTAYGRGISYGYLYDLPSGELEMVSRGGEDLFPFRAGWLSPERLVYTADGLIRTRELDDGSTGVIPFEATWRYERSSYDRKTRDFDSVDPRPVKGITNPVVSPEGNRIAFAALGDIYIEHVGGGRTQLTGPGSVDLDPDWSPDGRKIAYTSDRHGVMELWVYDLESGESRPVASGYENLSSPAWSSDGSRIAFLEHTHLNKWGSAELKAVRLADDEVETLHGPLFGPGKPSWSPDDRYVALMALDRRNNRFREGFNRFLIVSVLNRSARFVSPDRERTLGMRSGGGPVWAPDGSRIAYIRDGTLWSVPVDERGEITGSPVQLTERFAGYPSWSMDSESIVYLGMERIERVDLEGGAPEIIPIDLEWKPYRSETDYVIHAGRLFDGLSQEYLQNIDIVISGNRIVALEPHQPHRDGVVIDASNQVVMPGLFEMHSHQNSMVGERLGRIWLAYGITSVREPGADPYEALERMESWESATRPGPRLFFTGGLTDGSRIYYGLANSVTDRKHLEMELERARILEFDLIKTYVRMADADQERITTAAHEMGIPVSSHELYPAVINSVDAVEHLRGTSRRGYSLKLSALNRSYEDVILSLSRSGMSVTPTVVMHGGFLQMIGEHEQLLNHEQLRAFYSEEYIGHFVERAEQTGYGTHFGREGDTEAEAIQQSIRAIVEQGGVVTAGTDSPFVPFGTSLHVELWLYVEAGLTPFQALQTATIHAARAVGVGEDLGSVEQGKLADLVIVDGDPLENIRDAMRVSMVTRGGELYRLRELIDRE